MNSTIVQFPHSRPPRTEISQFVRIGEAYRQFEDLHASGHLPLRHVVVEASRIERQAEMIKNLRTEGIEIILDLGAAELSSINRITTHFKNAPWLGNTLTEPLGPNDFTDERIHAMALLAVKFEVSTVLAPTHFLGDPNFAGWLDVDLRLCERLRNSLDQNGGQQIGIDYTVISSLIGLSDTETRRQLAEGISNLPVENIWFRISGLGKELGPNKTRQMIRSLSGFHNLGRPTILDYSGGLPAQSALAFGVVSGASFGINEFNHFNAAGWHKPLPERDPDADFGRTQYIAIPGLGRSFSKKEFRLLAKARGGRRLLLPDVGTIANSIEAMEKNHKQIAAQDAVRSISRVESVTDLNRERHFLDKPLKETERKARELSRLKPSEALAKNTGVDLESLMKRATKHHEALEKVASALEKLHEERGSDAPRARPCQTRATKRSETFRTDEK